MATVVLDRVRVDFPIYGSQRSFRRAIFERAVGGIVQREGKHRERVIIKALAGISITIAQGDRLGLIGPNGSGKTTLLKVMAGIYEPIDGTVMVEGRLTPLFDTMPGVDDEDTGYENIVSVGLLLGMSREKIAGKVHDIEAFSELGGYLSLPVRSYSAGMKARLGLAIATAIDPEILLLDEGIGTVDARFAERATPRLNEFIERSSILVLASHSSDLIRSFCTKAALMQAGRILTIGPVEEVLEQYSTIAHNP